MIEDTLKINTTYQTSDNEIFPSSKEACKHQANLNLDSAVHKDPSMKEVISTSCELESLKDWLSENPYDILNYIHTHRSV